MDIGKYVTKIKSWGRDLSEDRPAGFMAAMGGLRDALLGIGVIFSLEDVQQTQLYSYYDGLIPDFSGMFIGVVLFGVGLLVLHSALTGQIKRTQVCLDIQGFVWLFSAIMYLLNFDLVLAMVFGIFFAIPAWYLSYYYKYKKKEEVLDSG